MKIVYSFVLLNFLLLTSCSTTLENDPTKEENIKIEEIVPEYHYENNVVSIDSISVEERGIDVIFTFRFTNNLDVPLFLKNNGILNKEDRTILPSESVDIDFCADRFDDGSRYIYMGIVLYYDFENQQIDQAAVKVNLNLGYVKGIDYLKEISVFDTTSK